MYKYVSQRLSISLYIFSSISGKSIFGFLPKMRNTEQIFINENV